MITKFNIKIKDIRPVVVYKLNTENEHCGICKNHIFSQNKSYVIGACNHTFFKQCLDKWLLKYDTCPICNIPWKLKSKSSTKTSTK
jgi:hypothetical protein